MKVDASKALQFTKLIIHSIKHGNDIFEMHGWVIWNWKEQSSREIHVCATVGLNVSQLKLDNGTFTKGDTHETCCIFQ